jgi:hypothetical protein
MATAKTQSVAITNGQIGQINDRLATKLRESGLSKDGVQAVLAAPNSKVIDEMVVVLRKHVEANAEMIVRRVLVKRNRTVKGAVDAIQYVNGDVLSAAPRVNYTGQDEEWVEVVLFPLKKFTSVQDVQNLITENGLTPDPQALATANEQDSSFADTHPNGTQWQDENGNFCCLDFSSWDGGRIVDCDRIEDGWRDGWFVGGSRASS